MIASSSTQVQVSGNLQGEKIAMDFDQNSLQHLQSVLINMYGDPEMAVIREIATNGRDATIEAGSTRPIEVTTPTVLSPFLRVRDYGCGLSRDMIETIFSKYGASTKRETNTQTGCLGIGSKSPLAYAPQFTVSSVRDGKRIECVVSLNDLGAGEITVIEPGIPTDEPNGTEVVVAAKRHNAMATKARSLFSYWPEGSVLLDGEPVATVEGDVLTDKPATARVNTPDGTQRDVRIERMVLRRDSGNSIMVMGGVPYPIRSEINNLGLDYSYSIVVWVGMGEAHFAPNREALRETPTTMQTIEAIHQHFDFAAAKSVQAAINSCKTAGEALRAMIRWTAWMPERLRKETYSYKGKDLPARFKMEDGTKMVVVSKQPRKLSSHSSYESLAADTAADAIWFYNYDRPSFSAGQRKKIDLWAESQWPSFPYGEGVPEHFIMVDKMPQSDFLDKSRCFDWQTTIKPIRVPRSGGGGGYNSGRLAGSYDCWIAGDVHYEIPAENFDTEEPIYYFVKYDRWTERSDARRFVNTVTHFEPACTVVWLTQNRVDKFRRNFPDAIDVKEACRLLRQEWIDTLDGKTMEMLGFHDKVDTTKFRSLDGHGPILCPAIADTIERIEQMESDEAFKAVLKEREALLDTPSFSTSWTDPLTSTRFPLAVTYYDSLPSNIEHAVHYINAIVRAEALQGELDMLAQVA